MDREKWNNWNITWLIFSIPTQYPSYYAHVPFLFLLIGSCASVDSYRIGDYSVNITSQSRVNEEYQKVCVLNCSRTVKGFVNYHKKEMWSMANTPVIMHEIRHIVEGHYHKKQAFVE